jgi:hypothetical protein
MPRGDGTGPAGLGPRTGRGLGYCAGYDTPGYTKGPGMGLGRGWGGGRGRGRWYGYGRGMGWGRGWGRGYGVWGGYGAPYYDPSLVPVPAYAPPATSADQLTMLKQEKDYMESELKGIQDALGDISKRIDELEKSE